MDIELSFSEEKLLKEIAFEAKEMGICSYLIGGFVRDRILKRPCKDIDVVCTGDAILFAQKVANRLGGHKPLKVNTFKRFGTAMLMYNDWQIEFVGARKESYSADSRKPVVFPGSIEDDQNRRDFTINALAIRLDKNFGELVDPFEGIKDLQAKKLITPLDPAQTFSDDPLRMLRAIRFATQLGFSIDDRTFQSIQDQSNRIEIISMERIHIELNKILASPTPSVGLNLLQQSGLLKLILPELEAMKGVETRHGIGHKDNFYHTLQVVDNIAEKTENLWLRWAALLHDIGKPATKRFEENIGWTFHGHEVVGERIVQKIFKRLKLPLDHTLIYVRKLVALHQRPISLTKDGVSDSAIRRLCVDAGDEIDDLLKLCRSDITSKIEWKLEKYLENYNHIEARILEIEKKDHLRNWQPPISGELIMQSFNLNPCKQVGEIKNAIKDAILDGKIPNNYENAFEFMMKEFGQL